MSMPSMPVSRFTRRNHRMPAFLVTGAGQDARPNAIASLMPVSRNPPVLAYAVREGCYS